MPAKAPVTRTTSSLTLVLLAPFYLLRRSSLRLQIGNTEQFCRRLMLKKTCWRNSRGGVRCGTGDGIKQRSKLTDERVERREVVSDPGQDDGPLKGGDDDDCEVVGALQRHADLDQTLGERFKPPVECPSQHFS